ncbi:MAG: MBL fold metallo-hydrolase [Planctomycetales bacterium]|nr:MBL fold metallo-hydrolase [Planctomycetales bacterium]
MKLILLGTTGYHPSDRRQTACFMLPELGVVFDAGTALYRASKHIETDHLDIFLTHAHLDHCVGLTFLFDLMAERPVQQIRTYAEPEKLAAIQAHLLNELLFPVQPPGEMLPLQPVHLLSGGGKLTHYPLEHPGGSVGFRADWPDRSLAYVTDTVASADAAYVEKIRGVDLLVHECYFADGNDAQARLTGHSCLTPVLEVAAAAKVKRLVLVHINPLMADDAELGLAAAKHLFPRVEIGVDGMEIEF